MQEIYYFSVMSEIQKKNLDIFEIFEISEILKL